MEKGRSNFHYGTKLKQIYERCMCHQGIKMCVPLFDNGTLGAQGRSQNKRRSLGSPHFRSFSQMLIFWCVCVGPLELGICKFRKTFIVDRRLSVTGSPRLISHSPCQCFKAFCWALAYSVKILVALAKRASLLKMCSRTLGGDFNVPMAVLFHEIHYQ